MKKIIFILLIIILSTFTLSGCWDREEPENFAVVIGIGFDYNPDRDMYKIVMQIASPLIALGIEGGGAEDKPAFWTVSAWGHTTIDAISNLRKKVTRQIFYAHTHVFVISEKLLQEKGNMPVIDALERTRLSRPIVLMAVTSDDVTKVLEVDFPIENYNVKGIMDMIKLTNAEIGSTTAESGKDFINKLSTPGLEPVAVNLELLNEGNENQTNEENEEKNNQNTGQLESELDNPPPIRIEGITTFSRDQLAGFLNSRETRGWNWVMGQVERAVINIKLPEIENKLSLIARESSSRIEPVIQDGEPEINLMIKATGDIQGVMGRGQFEQQSELTQSLKRKYSEVIRNDIKQAITQAQLQKSDIFGFGNSFYRLKYDKWQEVKDDWDDIFSDLKVNINVEVELQRTGMINRSVEPQ